MFKLGRSITVTIEVIVAILILILLVIWLVLTVSHQSEAGKPRQAPKKKRYGLGYALRR